MFKNKKKKLNHISKDKIMENKPLNYYITYVFINTLILDSVL